MSESLQSDATRILSDLETYVRNADFKGWDPYDALNSALLSRLTQFHPYVQRAAIHAVRLMPWNPRPLLGIQKGYNPTALSLFIDMYVNLFEIEGDGQYLDTAEDLLGRLVELACIDDKEELGWGRNFKYLTTGEAHEVGKPLTFLCARIGHSMVRLARHRAGERIASHLRRIVTTMLRRGRVLRAGKHTFLGYSAEPNPRRIINVSALSASLFLLYLRSLRVDDVEIEGVSLAATANELTDTILRLQENDGSWPYGFTADGRRLGNLDFHQGFVVDHLLHLLDLVGDERRRHGVETAYERGLRFLVQQQICPDGAFRWRYPRKYPIDIHNQAQGILTLSRDRADRHQALLDTVVAFTVRHFWNSREGYFAYLKWPLGTNRIPYLRWAQGWMGFALSEYFLRKGAAQHVRNLGDN
jgi:hypothetical protein